MTQGRQGPRERWTALLERVRPRLARARQRLAAWAAHARARSGPAVERARAWLAEAGAGALRGLDRMRRGAGPRARQAAASVRGGWARVRPALGRAGRAIRRRAPSPRQALVVLALLFGAGLVLWERCGLGGCPDVAALSSYQPGGAAVLLDRNGERFADLAPMEYEVVPLDSLPPHVPAAFVAVEDRRFYDHRGVDWVRVLGAAWADLRAGGLVQGSSTIPMQLSRTLFPERIRREDKTLRRKLLEVRVAGEIEDRFSKGEILELYLNHVYLGAGTYGIQAASRYWFGKDATELDLEEAAMLAGMPRAPSQYDPRRHPEAARTRRDLVLSLMEQQELLTPGVADSARALELVVPDEPYRDPDGDLLAPYFVQHVRRMLEDELGESLYAERLRIHTTLDPVAQRAAEEELEARLRAVERGDFGRARGERYERAGGAADYLQGAVVVMDAAGGEVRAWVGGRDFDHSRYDRARLARRQTGSAFKPFVYAAALEAGLSPSQPVMDSPYRLARQGAPDWEPRNYSGGFEGPLSMREALVRSQNVPAVRVAAAVGQEPVRDLARRVGLSGAVPESPVSALGVTTATPLEMATAYATFATLGLRPSPRFVLRVEDEDGEVLLETEPRSERVMDPAIAYLLTDMLSDVVDRGTGAVVRSVGFRGAAAGKTGTTSDATDVWFVGYTPELVSAFWVGFDEVRPIASRATGGGVAAPAWGRTMETVYDDRPVPDWPAMPAGIVAVWVDPETGMPLQRGCRPRYDDARRELFLEDAVPITICPRRSRRGWDDRMSSWLESLFGRRHSVPSIPGTIDPDLGVPRLPTSEKQAYGRDRDPWFGGGAGAYGDDDRYDDGRYDRDRYDDDRADQARERARAEWKREQERLREERKRYQEWLREERQRREEAARERRRRAEDDRWREMRAG